jgi:hypothetical protein
VPGTARLVGLYEFKDASGALLAIKGRFQWPDPDKEKGYDKTFCWRLPDGKWSEGIKAKFPNGISGFPLWGVENLATEPDAPVWVLEGEECVKALRQRGQLALCGGWGASQQEFPPSTFEPLRGRIVRLWPDNDEAGRRYMAAVKAALKGIAKSIVVINAPVPPKGDAVDYFAAGGTVEKLLDGILDTPAVAVIEDDHFECRVPTDTGTVLFEFSAMSHARKLGEPAVQCELTVRMMGPTAEDEPYTLRINLLSQSARSQLSTELRRHFGTDRGAEWTLWISKAFTRVLKAFETTERGTLFADLPEEEHGDTFLIPDILPEGQPTIFFGDGSAGKSMLAMTMAVSVALGVEWCGRPAKQANVLYVDWETHSTPKIPKRRLRRLLQPWGAANYMGDVPVYYWPAKGGTLGDQVLQIRRFVAAHDIGLVIIDSGGVACGGAPEDSQVALEFFRSVAKLGCTSAIICHINQESAKNGTASKPFGSAFWHNMARRTFFVSRSSEPESDVIDLGLYCRKVNDGRLPGPMGVRVEFQPNGGIMYDGIPAGELSGNWVQMADWERIRNTILDFPQGYASIGDISRELGMTPNHVRDELMQRRQAKAGGPGVFRVMGGHGNGQQWAVAAEPGEEVAG